MGNFDYANYYKQAYWQEKNKNIQLAAQAASKEQDVLLLGQKYERIAGNPAMRLWNKIQRIFTRQEKEQEQECKIEDTVCREDSVSVKQYEKNVFFQKHPYQCWINEHESTVQDRQEADEIRTEVVFLEECGGAFSLKDIEKPYVLFVSGKGRLHAGALQAAGRYLEKNPEAMMVYAAEDSLGKGSQGEEIREKPWFKPAYSPETLLAFFYFGNVFAVRKERFASVPWAGAKDWKENIYDFVLKAEEALGDGAKNGIVSVDEVWFHKDTENCGTAESGGALTGKAGSGSRAEGSGEEESTITGIWGYEKEFGEVKQKALKRRGYEGTFEEGNVPGIFHVCMKAEGKVSVIILSKDHPDVLEHCIKSIREKTDYPDYEIIVIDNGSYEKNRIRSEELAGQYGFRYICDPMEFNFSAMCNRGAKEAKGEYLLFLNDDMEVLEGSYMRRMAGQASVSGVGAVGAKLWYPDGFLIQHAGITNLAIGPGHKLVSMPDDRMYYDGRNYFTFNYLAVTGACLMIRKAVYGKVGGMDETMPVAYNDVELCFCLEREGYRNVLRNDAVLFHHESLSRGLDEADREKAKRLLEERKRLYGKYPEFEGRDPYYSPCLLQDSSKYGCSAVFEHQKEEVKKPVSEKNFQKDNNARELKEQQLAANIEDVCMTGGEEAPSVKASQKTECPNTVKITGWSLLKGVDNCHYKRSLILEDTENARICITEVIPFLREDVSAAFAKEPDTKRMEMTGMVARFEKKAIGKGVYRLGILYEDMLSDRMFYRMLENTLEV